MNIPPEDVLGENYHPPTTAESLHKEGETFTFPYYMVGDEIFQLKDYLMRPYPGGRRGKLPIDKAVFNYRLSRARRVIENSFGILVARWRLFRKPIRADKDNVTSYTLAAVILHNYLQQAENASYCSRGFVDSEIDADFRPGVWRCAVRDDFACFKPFVKAHGSRYENSAVKMKADLKHYLNSAEGLLPWQLDYVQRNGRADDEGNEDIDLDIRV